MPQTKRIDTVDALRGIASLAVCIYHLAHESKLFSPRSPVTGVTSFGWLGVEVFFVISGFIIPYSLQRSGYQLSNYGTFVLKRIIRLDPPYLVIIAIIIPLDYLCAIAPGYHGPPCHITISQVLLHFAYLNAFFPQSWLSPVFWTLAIEFQYYLLVGLLFPLICHKNLGVRIALFVLLGTAAFLLPNGAFIPHWFFLFMLGMLAFQRHAGLAQGADFWVLLAVLACGSFFSLSPIIAFVGLATVLSIVFVRASHAALVFLGSISYSLYLVHVPIGQRAVNLGGRFAHGLVSQLVVLFVAVAMCIGAAYLLYRFVEKPAQIWSSRLKYQRQKPVIENALPIE